MELHDRRHLAAYFGARIARPEGPFLSAQVEGLIVTHKLSVG